MDTWHMIKLPSNLIRVITLTLNARNTIGRFKVGFAEMGGRETWTTWIRERRPMTGDVSCGLEPCFSPGAGQRSVPTPKDDIGTVDMHCRGIDGSIGLVSGTATQ